MNIPFTTHATHATWGRETLQQIDSDFWMPRRNLYAESAPTVVGTASKISRADERQPASAWDCGILLAALAGAMGVDARAYRPAFDRLLQSMEPYRLVKNGVDAYDVYPGQSKPTRCYDDNEWIVLALCEAYQATNVPRYRVWATEVFRFVQSGEDKKLGGGIYWNEALLDSKNTCSNGPGAFGALRLYQITGRREYLSLALRVYDWTNRTMQDSDGLFWDNIHFNHSIDRTKWSYNTALMLRTNCLLYTITKDKRYHAEAERVAQAARARWIRLDNGAIKDEGNFAYSLCEAFIDVGAMTSDPIWRDTVTRAMTFVHDRMRNGNGRYGRHWDTPTDPAKPLTQISMRDQASVARGYFVLAG